MRVRSMSLSSRALTQGFRSLNNRNYRLFWFGQMVSLAGTWMQDVALSWLVLSLTDSPMALGLTMTIRFLPALVFSLYGGILADKLPKRQTIIAAQTVQMLIALAMAVLVSTELVTVLLIYVLAGLRGTVDAVEGPTRQAFVPEMVGRDDVPNAVALNSTLFNSARIIGPAIGAVIISTLGIAACFYLNAFSFLAVIAGLFAMRPGELHAGEGGSGAGASGSLREGFRYVRATPDIMIVFIVIAALATFGYNFQTTLPLVTKYILNAEASTLSLLMTVMGAGSVTAGLIAAYRGKPRRHMMLVAGGLFSLLFLLVGLSTSRALTTVLMFFVGFCGVFFMTSASTRVQLLVPSHLRGRVLGIYFLLFVGTTPIGSYVTGRLAEGLGVRVAMVILALLCLSGVVAATGYAFRVGKASRGSARPAPVPALGAEARLRSPLRADGLNDPPVQE